MSVSRSNGDVTYIIQGYGFSHGDEIEFHYDDSSVHVKGRFLGLDPNGQVTVDNYFENKQRSYDLQLMLSVKPMKNKE